MKTKNWLPLLVIPMVFLASEAQAFAMSNGNGSMESFIQSLVGGKKVLGETITADYDPSCQPGVPSKPGQVCPPLVERPRQFDDNKQKMPEQNQNDQNNQNDDNMNNGGCSIGNGNADVRQANNIIRDSKNLLKIKNLSASLISDINSEIALAQKFLADFKAANDTTRCDVLDAWRNPDNGIDKAENWNNLRNRANFANELVKLQKEAKNLSIKAVTTKIGKTALEVQPIFTAYITNMTADLAELSTLASATEVDSDSIQIIMDNYRGNAEKNTGSFRCSLDLAVQFAKVDAMKNLDADIKQGIIDVRTSFYDSIKAYEFQTACQLGNEIMKTVRPIMDKPMRKASPAINTKLEALQKTIDAKYGSQDQYNQDNNQGQ